MPWTMPHVEVSMPLIWYHEGNKDSPHACICSKVGQFGIDINVIMPDMINTRPISGVPHVSDPRLGKQSVQESGTWDYPEWLKSALFPPNELIRRLRELNESVPTDHDLISSGAPTQTSGLSMD